jgi:hypothetical protein
LVITLSHDEVTQFANAEDVIAKVHDIVGALGAANPIVASVTGIVAAWIQFDRALMIASDHGFGVYLLIPYATIGLLWAGIFPVSVSPPTYTITSVASRKVLDVTGDSREDHALIIQYADHGGLNQQWQLVPVDSNGFVKIVSPSSGKVLDIPWASTADGIQIQQYHDNGAVNQQWSVVPMNPDNPDIVKIISRSSGKVLDVRWASPYDGAEIQQYTENDSAAQQWKLTSHGDPFRPH